MNLQYRSKVAVEDSALGECTIHRAATADGKRWWNLWFYVARETDGVPADFVVPVNPSGPFIMGPGGRTWGLVQTGPGVWQVSPSINVLGDARAHAAFAGEEPAPGDAPSLWHQTPTIVGVPDGEVWMSGAP